MNDSAGWLSIEEASGKVRVARALQGAWPGDTYTVLVAAWVAGRADGGGTPEGTWDSGDRAGWEGLCMDPLGLDRRERQCGAPHPGDRLGISSLSGQPLSFPYATFHDPGSGPSFGLWALVG